MTTSPLLAPFLTISTQEYRSPSPSWSPSVLSNSISPQVSPFLASLPASPSMHQPREHSLSASALIIENNINNNNNNNNNIPQQQQQHLHHQQSTSSYLNCPAAEQRLRSSFAQHEEYQQQMRHRLSQKDHPLHHPNPESVRRHHQQLITQLEYYRQLQIMHCQRVRDVELLHLQQQQLQQQQPQPLHVIKRFQLAQRMLQMQKMYHAHQIQKIQYLQKINRLQGGGLDEEGAQPSCGNSEAVEQKPSLATATSTVTATAPLLQSLPDVVSEEDMARLEIDPNTMHIPVRAASRPRIDMQELLGTTGNSSRPRLASSGASTRQSRVQELARIVLPSPDQIRKLRHQRLKHQARLRQAAAIATSAEPNLAKSHPHSNNTIHHHHQPCATDKPHSKPTSDTMGFHVSSALPISPVDSTSAASCHQKQQHEQELPRLHSSANSLQGTVTPTSVTAIAAASAASAQQLAKQVQAAVWTSSTTSVMPRSRADLAYKRQLRHSMALQQHMIQDHTHRYRIFQAFCLLQRAREAQAVDEVQAQKRKQIQTLAWVEALRQSKELEIPQ